MLTLIGVTANSDRKGGTAAACTTLWILPYAGFTLPVIPELVNEQSRKIDQIRTKEEKIKNRRTT